MKQIDNRQQKLIQMKAQTRASQGERPRPGDRSEASAGGEASRGGSVFGLVSNLLVASKIAQSGKQHHLSVHNFDKAEALLAHARAKAPALILLDWDGCEAEAFKVLKEISAEERLKKIPTVGYLSQTKAPLKEEAQRAGCHRVYAKTEFLRSLDELMTRYAQ